jgi:hypothetical protein
VRFNALAGKTVAQHNGGGYFCAVGPMQQAVEALPLVAEGD